MSPDLLLCEVDLAIWHVCHVDLAWKMDLENISMSQQSAVHAKCTQLPAKQTGPHMARPLVHGCNKLKVSTLHYSHTKTKPSSNPHPDLT